MEVMPDQQRTVAFAEFALPADVRDRIIGDVRAAEQASALGHLQSGVEADEQAASQVNHLGERHRAAAMTKILIMWFNHFASSAQDRQLRLPLAGITKTG
jgi:hypothetical protein